MTCQEIIGCNISYSIDLPVCGINCPPDPIERNRFNYLNSQQKIFKLVRLSSSQYQDKLISNQVLGSIKCSNEKQWNQTSDRIKAGQPTAYVPRKRMGIRPGGLGTGGSKSAGVDIKHNSYARFIAKKRGMSIC